MPQRKGKTKGTYYFAALLMLVSGLGIGWLIGLSVSPTLHIIVGSIIALVAGVVGSLAGVRNIPSDETSESVPIEHKKRFRPPSVDPMPLTALVVGLAIGAAVGVYARTNDLLGPNPEKFARKWAGTGLEAKEIQSRLFNTLYPVKVIDSQQSSEKTRTDSSTPPDPAKSPADNRQPSAPVRGTTSKPSVTSVVPNGERPRQFTAGLYGLSIADCDFVAGKHGEELRTRLRALGKPEITKAAIECPNDACLEELRKTCPKR